MQIEQQNYLNTPSLSDVDETYLRVCMPFSKFRLHKINSLDQLSLFDDRDHICLPSACVSLQVVWNLGPELNYQKAVFKRDSISHYVILSPCKRIELMKAT